MKSIKIIKNKLVTEYMLIFSNNSSKIISIILVDKNNKNIIITNMKINIHLCKELFYNYQQVYTCKIELQGRNPKLNILFQIKTNKL